MKLILKNRNKISNVRLAFYLLSGFVLSSMFWVSCAQIGSLSGGEKDTIPPVIYGSNPAEKTTNFKEKYIQIFFDEYFVLKDISSSFLSSPLLEEKPRFKIKNKSLVIKFNEKLSDTVTYTFSFGDAIQDYHENNPIKNYKFVISTGNVVDSFEISGSVMDALTHKIDEKMLVMFYREYNDSTPLLKKPYYIARTDTAGKFKVDFIKPGKYRVFALKDIDANYLFNLPNEKIAYIDSFIVPTVTQVSKIDTFKVSKIKINPTDSLLNDTIVNDSIVMSISNDYGPKNLQLFSFVEDREKQYVAKAERPTRTSCLFSFNKQIDSLMVKAIDPFISTEKILIEKEDTSKNALFWLTDSTHYNLDSLKFEISYFNKDSVGNPFLEKDTSILFFDIVADSVPQKYLDVSLSNKEHDFFNDYVFESKTPIELIDSGKIQLYKVVDTLVDDPKKQSIIKKQRRKQDEIFFAFERPLVNDLRLEPLKFRLDSSWYSLSYDNNRDTVICKITNDSISQKDTLNVVVHFDNDFYLNQIQNFTDTAVFVTEKQKILSFRRVTADSVKVFFNLPSDSEPDFTAIDSSSTSWYNISKHENDFTLKIKDDNYLYSDTLMLSVKMFIGEDSLGNDNYFTDTIPAIYNTLKQAVHKFKRVEKDSFYIVFRKPLFETAEVLSANFTVNKNWNSLQYSKLKDTVFCKITNEFTSEIDTLQVAVKYNTKYKRNQPEIKTDTIQLVYKPSKVKKDPVLAPVDDDKNKTSVSVEVPVGFKFYKDSTYLRKYHIKYAWKGDSSYIVKFDSIALTDIYGLYNKAEEVKFTVKSKDSYGRIILNLSNVKKISNKNFYNTTIEEKEIKQDTNKIIISDSTLTDSLKRVDMLQDSIQNIKTKNDSIFNSVLPKGKLIIYIQNKKKNIVKTLITRKDTSFVIDNLNPDEYNIRLVYDVNDNDKWDTGDYLKNIQPERILIYDKTITVIAKMDAMEKWVIKPQLKNNKNGKD